jgi:hypothetical protein
MIQVTTHADESGLIRVGQTSVCRLASAGLGKARADESTHGMNPAFVDELDCLSPIPILGTHYLIKTAFQADIPCGKAIWL